MLEDTLLDTDEFKRGTISWACLVFAFLFDRTQRLHLEGPVSNHPPPYLVYRDKLIADGTSQDEDLDGNRSSLRTGLMFSKFINVNLQLRIRWSTPRIPSQRLPFGRFSKMPRLMLKDAISEGLKVFSPLPAGKQLLNLASDVFELSVGHYTIALYSRRRRR